jgi:hypothetical protein
MSEEKCKNTPYPNMLTQNPISHGGATCGIPLLKKPEFMIHPDAQ